MAEREEKYVTWKAFLSIVITVTSGAVALGASIGVAVLQSHNSRPHEGSVETKDLDRVLVDLREIDAKVDTMVSDIAHIKAKINP